jgi:predicted aldo/keto reductase-like oxidoreductase
MKILLINSVCGIRSTGRICTDLAEVAERAGHTVKIAYGQESVPEKYQKYAVRIGNPWGVRLHVALSRIFDKSGFYSACATRKFLKWVDAYKPDLVHLQNIHGYYLHVGMLFDYLKKRNIPVFVMEPVRGGRLVKLDQETEERLRQIRPSASMPEWAFRYIQSFDEVCVTLSGMSNMEQLEENIKTFSEDKRTSNEENAVLYSIAKDMMKNTVPCTECRYCTEYCPMQLDIPDLLDHYNELTFARGGFSVKSLEFIPEDKRPDKCIGCKSCENVCPQKIKISEVLATFNDMIEKATK